VDPFEDRDPGGGKQIFAGSHTDITDSLDRERFYRTVLDTIPSLIFVKSADLRFVFVNKAVAEVFGKQDTDEIIGKTDADLNPNGDQNRRFAEADKYVITNRKLREIREETLTDAQGNKRILTTKKLPLDYPGRAGTHVLGVATDITDLKRARRPEGLTS
jgi:PAS domain S-box-containing protein